MGASEDRNGIMQHRGVWLPDHEHHLIEYLDKGPIVDGKGTYQYHKIQLALEYVKQWRTAIDVGGHVGLWSMHLSKRFEHVEAFEPLQRGRECFVENVTADNVTLHPYALGAKPQIVKMRTHQDHSMWSYVDHSGDQTAEVKTLDSFGLDEVDFVKIDTEGFELQVIKGGIDTISRWKPVMIVEQKPRNGSRYGYSDRAALDFLIDRGWKIVAQKAGDYVLTWA